MSPRTRRLRPAIVGLVGLVAVLRGEPARAADGDLRIEVHYQPVPNVQLAIWLEDKDGKWVQDLLVTQATGKLGIGNRPGVWNFLSSWRAPYGPRPSVLPIWAHRRGKTYPRLVFFDPSELNQTSLGYHEATSSAENYYCRPLAEAEHNTISVDTMTCPSPAVFQTDKGRFDPGATSPYPPRNDLLEFEESADSPDARSFAELNDLDAVTAATPPGNQPAHVTATISAETVADRGPLTVWLEVNLEHDENNSYDYDRETDHLVDPRLASYGVEYLGQPSVAYKLAFDPRDEGFLGTSDYVGYGDWNGATGTLHPPDATISTTAGSGADRLQRYTLNDETFRLGVYAYGDGDEPDPDWGHCEPRQLPAVTDLELEPLSFDKVRVHYTIPAQSDPEFEVGQLGVHLLTGEAPLTPERLDAAHLPPYSIVEQNPPGTPSILDVEQLWGNYTYQVGLTYEDRCGNRSALATATITTEAQKFQQVEGFCFIATAAYGAAWVTQVQALRWFRDAFLKPSPIGRDLVRFYYAYSPPLARVVHHQPVLRSMVRVVLQPFADLARRSTAALPRPASPHG
jgi:hypothetical protein